MSTTSRVGRTGGHAGFRGSIPRPGASSSPRRAPCGPDCTGSRGLGSGALAARGATDYHRPMTSKHAESSGGHKDSGAPAESFSKSLERMNRFQEPEARAVIADLGLPAGSRGLDVGCGVGLYALWLAEGIGPAGRVIGVEPGTERGEEARALG